MHCLSHHEILAIAGPFVRAGWDVDLRASDRAARKLVFREAPACAATGTHVARLSGLGIRIELDSMAQGWFRLVRHLLWEDSPVGPLSATLEATGRDPRMLLEQVLRTPAESQFVCADGFLLAKSAKLRAATHGDSAGAPEGATTRVTHRVVALIRGRSPGDLTFTLAIAGEASTSACINLETRDPTDLPDDLLAVLGWEWGVLRASSATGRHLWSSSVRLRGHGEARERDCARKLDRAMNHLARTLPEAPHRYHERYLPARWAVFARRSIPAGVWLLLLTELALAHHLQMAGQSWMRMVLLGVPVALLALFLFRSEAPRFEIPGVPRRLKESGWSRSRPSTHLPSGTFVR